MHMHTETHTGTHPQNLEVGGYFLPKDLIKESLCADRVLILWLTSNVHHLASTQRLWVGTPDPWGIGFGSPARFLPDFGTVAIVTTFRESKRTAWTDEPLFKKIALQIN